MEIRPMKWNSEDVICSCICSNFCTMRCLLNRFRVCCCSGFARVRMQIIFSWNDRVRITMFVFAESFLFSADNPCAERFDLSLLGCIQMGISGERKMFVLWFGSSIVFVSGESTSVLIEQSTHRSLLVFAVCWSRTYFPKNGSSRFCIIGIIPSLSVFQGIFEEIDIWHNLKFC